MPVAFGIYSDIAMLVGTRVVKDDQSLSGLDMEALANVKRNEIEFLPKSAITLVSTPEVPEDVEVQNPEVGLRKKDFICR